MSCRCCSAVDIRGRCHPDRVGKISQDNWNACPMKMDTTRWLLANGYEFENDKPEICSDLSSENPHVSQDILSKKETANNDVAKEVDSSLTEIISNIEKLDINKKEECNDVINNVSEVLSSQPIVNDTDLPLPINNIQVKELCKDPALIESNFKKCVAGYHYVNQSSINETVWEEINTIIFSSLGIEIYSKSDGSHLSGMDIDCSFGKISNKSAKYSKNKKSIDISSYRLTTVCSESNHGTPEDFIHEINRRKNFDYYSFILRDESDSNTIEYDWLLIPSEHPALSPSSYEWVPLIGKTGKKKNMQIGWTTNEINGCKMSITFSMSSQLWIHIEMTEEIKKYIVANTTVSKTPIYNYIDLYNILHK